MDSSNKVLDSSFMHLKQDSPEKKKSNKVILPRIKTQENQQNTNQSPTKTKKKSKRKILPGYQIADLNVALQFLDTQSYRKKIIGPDGQPQYQPFGVCDDLSELKQYGLGIYLYLELIKRLIMTFILISCLVAAPIAINYGSKGLQGYADSFTLTLAKFSIGNLSDADQQQYLIITICDILTMIVLFGFYVHWRSFIGDLLEQSERDHNIVNPTLYAISVSGFDPSTPNLQDNLKAHIDGLYRGAFEVEIVYDYSGNFKKFVEYDEAIQEVEKEKQVIKQTDKDQEDLQKYEKQLDQIEQELSHISQAFQPLYAIIHFRNLKAKYAFINNCKKYALVNKFSYKFRRCICCMPHQPERLKLLGTDELLIQSTNLARPQQYNWNNLDISTCSRVFRVILSILLLIIIIVITSSLIVFCTLYVSSTSSCYSFDPATLLSEALGDSQILYCYCNEHFTQIYLDAQIQNACSTIEQDILVNNVLQISASVISAITNVLLIVIVSFIGQYLLKPSTKPSQYSFAFVGVLVSNYINSTVLPLLLNGNIFGFQSVSYLTWVSFIDFNKVSIFSDFDTDWFAVISPYYVNFFIIACLSPLIQLTVFCLRRSLIMWWVKKKCQNSDPDKITIQKEANKTITMFLFDYPAEQALICLQLFMCFMYSSLIPLLVPIFTIGLIISFFCKRYILFHFSIRIPANQNLADKTMNLIPFIILIHGLMGVWSHTATGLFSSSAYILNVDFGVDSPVLVRGLTDVLMLGATALILLWIIIDWILIGFISGLKDCCKDELELPVSLASVENTSFAERIRKANILGSYKVSNHPIYGHAIKAFKQLLRCRKLQTQEKLNE